MDRNGAGGGPIVHSGDLSRHQKCKQQLTEVNDVTTAVAGQSHVMTGSIETVQVYSITTGRKHCMRSAELQNVGRD